MQVEYLLALSQRDIASPAGRTRNLQDRICATLMATSPEADGLTETARNARPGAGLMQPQIQTAHKTTEARKATTLLRP